MLSWVAATMVLRKWDGYAWEKEGCLSLKALPFCLIAVGCVGPLGRPPGTPPSEAECRKIPHAQTRGEWGDDWPTLENADHIWRVEVPDQTSNIEALIPVRDYPMAGLQGMDELAQCANNEVFMAFTNDRMWLSGDQQPPCDGVPPYLTYQTAVSMPHWRLYFLAIYIDRIQWSKRYAELRWHELGHALINIRIFHHMESIVNMVSCDETGSMIHTLDQIRLGQHRAYDHCTCHGQCQDSCEMATALFDGVTVTFSDGHR